MSLATLVAGVFLHLAFFDNVENAPLFEPLTDDLINYVNLEANTTWKAGVNFEDATVEYVKSLCGVVRQPDRFGLPYRFHDVDPSLLPPSFDARTVWPHCPTIREIRDQGDCGSCWAFGAVEAMSDRICIASKGLVNAHISAQDLLSCCTACGDGCNGGDPQKAWAYYQNTGLVTGGQFHSYEGCQPYSIAACEHHVNGTLPRCKPPIEPTPKCQRTCSNRLYKVPYRRDKHFGRSAYRILSNHDQIRTEILNHGPVEADFVVFADFLSYRTGVYKHVTGDELGGHAIKILGWGVDHGTQYWLAANSWNPDWGDNGYFKILRGVNECGIEDGIFAGEPML